MKRAALVAAFLFALGLVNFGCVTPRQMQLETRVVGVPLPWAPSGTPLRPDLCMRLVQSLTASPVYRHGVPYTVLARCVEVGD